MSWLNDMKKISILKFKNNVGWVKLRPRYFDKSQLVIKGVAFGRRTLMYYSDKQEALSTFKILKDGLEQGQRLVEDGKL